MTEDVYLASDVNREQATPASTRYRIFLLSPANAGGTRAKLISAENAGSRLALRLRREGLALGEAFSFISGLYFRGKLAYVEAFGSAPPGLPGALVITSCRGLVPPAQTVTASELREIFAQPFEPTQARYRRPLVRDARRLADLAGTDCDIVLLGSIATAKYVEPLLGVFGERLLVPAEFIGRGDLSRGGLMLRCARAGVELSYIPVAKAARHGSRPPRLPRLARV
jgi:hypothetical protein